MNKLICGDNLDELQKLDKESVDLIYIDPPFFSNRHYEVIWGDKAETRSFDDRWEGGIEHYIGWMKPRVQAMYDVLKPTGSMYLHCDWHASHKLRCMLDEVFGEKQFQDEIIWWFGGGGASKNRFGRKHNNIYFYTKSNKYTFNVDSVREPYKWTNGQKRADGSERDLSKGKIPDDVWNIHGVIPWSKERLGYPTQKPEALLERIIKASSNKGDVVLDAFCGCGTALSVAQKLERQWIGIDISPTAINVIKERLKPYADYEVTITPTTEADMRNLSDKEFQIRVVNMMEGNHSKKKTGDMGLDGYFEYHNIKGTKEAGIQVKQSDSIGRNVVDNFKAALDRKKWKFGFIVAFSFGKGAHEEVARLKNAGELNIKLITVEELLNKKVKLWE